MFNTLGVGSSAATQGRVVGAGRSRFRMFNMKFSSSGGKCQHFILAVRSRMLVSRTAGGIGQNFIDGDVHYQGPIATLQSVIVTPIMP